MPSNPTNPWADATNQAVGALYKYYMSQPTASDALKNQYMQSQIDQNMMKGQMNQRLYDMGGWDGAPAAVQTQLYALQHPEQAQTVYNLAHPAVQVDLGDRKQLVSPINASKIFDAYVGTAPEMKVNKDETAVLPVPGTPSRQVMGGQTPMSNLFASVIQQESGGDPNALSPAGAAGIAQIMPDTARDPGYGVRPLQNWDGVDPRTAPVDEQVRFGQDYLNAMINNRGGNVAEGLASYNAGPGAVAEHGGIPPYAETQNYVQSILKNTDIPSQTGQSIQPIPMSNMSISQSEKATGKNNISNWVNELAGLYSQLEKNQGVISENNGTLANMTTQLATTGPGSFVARGMGGEDQAIRDRINGINSMIFTALKPVLGLTGTQLDSKAEADYIKRMMGGVDMDVNATRQLLNTINRAYGNQDLSSVLQPSNQYGEDVMSTAAKYNISPQEVVQRLRNAGVNGY